MARLDFRQKWERFHLKVLFIFAKLLGLIHRHFVKLRNVSGFKAESRPNAILRQNNLKLYHEKQLQKHRNHRIEIENHCTPEKMN
jgi:hypothetical protein